MFRLWKKYGFEMIFAMSLVMLVFIFFINLLVGREGSYSDHTNLIWELLKVPSRQQMLLNESGQHVGESKGERECRRVAELITGRPFPKARPSFLRNDVTGGNNLEIDCFNSDLGIGIEYNGQQHYRYTPYFHSSKDAFYNTKYRDDMKKRLCEQAGVRLIVVPYTIREDQIEPYLIQEFRKIYLR